MKFTKSHARILAVIAHAGRKGIIVPGIAKRLKAKRYERISPRCTELYNMGKIGVRRKQTLPATGKGNAVYVAVKYLSSRGRHDAQQRAKLLDVRLQVNRGLAKLSQERKIAAYRAFLSILSR